jgi:two-component system chemotaxis response regulator CheB
MRPGPGSHVTVLVVDDSASSRELLVGLLNGDPQLQVVGVAGNGEDAVAAAQRLRPDVITMDIHMPVLDGFAATRRIMELCPTRIVMVTASSIPDDVAASFRAMEAGALAVLAKPVGPGHPHFEACKAEVLRTVKLMAEVKVVRRRATGGGLPTGPRPAAPEPAVGAPVRLVAIGASTGGPPVLHTILSALRPGFDAPIVIVQHISSGFCEGLAQWLAQASGFPVRVAEHGEALQAGVAYIAPDDFHVRVQGMGRLLLSEEPPEHGLRPSVSCLFRSVAQAYGSQAAGVLLTGMGRDGAAELKLMREAGALTLAQDRASAVVYGMPGEAVKLGAAAHVLDPPSIAALLNRMVRRAETGRAS